MANVSECHVDDLGADEPPLQAPSGASLLITNEGAGAAHADEPDVVPRARPAGDQPRPQAQGQGSVRPHPEHERASVGPEQGATQCGSGQGTHEGGLPVHHRRR